MPLPSPARLSSAISGPRPELAVFDILRAGLAQEARCGLLTALVYDLEGGRSCRVWSDDVAAYPVGNYKRLLPGPYLDRVVRGGEAVATVDTGGLAELFFDWEKIRDLGFGSSLNIPAVVDGRLIGSANLLAVAGTYTPQMVTRALEWQPLVTLAFLLLARAEPGATFHSGVLIGTGGTVEG